MRVLIILAVATLTAAAPHLPSKSNGISEDGEVIKIEKALGEQRFIRSTDDSESTTDNSELEDSDSELSEESLWLADEKKWHEQENEGTETTELEGEASHEQEKSSSETEDLSGSIIPTVLVEDVDLNNANAETLYPQSSLYQNNLMPWDIPGAYSRRWLYELPQYYNRVPRISKH
ncbi:uncharacterized protein LOC121739989 [Aricia agestis]|uniref:uncharacterized protein LOC121739989 n=1 Tax=Aricia agestis TaxID=91739 RepID=UPI001C2049DC|nr:uncharacterized protein LOC121739989 [Aricia agestis]